MKKEKIGTKERLLKAAIYLFSEKGYDGTTVDEIVDAAKINKRMVYHYFGSKEAIYREVLKVVFSRLQRVELAIIHLEDSIEKALEDLVRAYFNFLAGNPDFVNLLLWENLGKGRHLQSEQVLLSKAPILDLLSKILSEGARRGLIRKGFDPKHLFINMIGLCLIYFSNTHTLSHSVGIDLKSPAVLNAGIQQVLRLLKYGILKSYSD
ncbi:MAG: TetR/AcrR family transcriptional regulator [Verrucomicrobiota bacterium]